MDTSGNFIFSVPDFTLIPYQFFRSLFLIRLYGDIPDKPCSFRGGCRSKGIYIRFLDLA
jgi:hypothetical protein